VGVYIDRRLETFAVAQLDDRLLARTGNVPSSRTTGSLPPPLAFGGVPDQEFATIAARTDAAGVTTTVLDASGRIIPPQDPPATWHALPDLAPDLFQRALSGDTEVGPRAVSSASRSYLVLDRGVMRQSSAPIVIQTSVPLTDVDALLRSFRLAYGIASLGALALAIAAGRPLARAALQPLRSLSRGLARVKPPNLGQALPVPEPRDELRELALAFNDMLAEVSLHVQAEQRLQEQLRRFVGDASHELRSPVTSLAGYLDLLLEHPTPATAERVAPPMKREIERVTRLVQDLLALTRLDAPGARTPPFEELDLGELAGGVVAAMSQPAAERQLRLDTPAEPLLVRGDAHELERALENLLWNAIQHTSGNGTIAVRLARDGGQVLLDVEDDGEGIAAEHVPRIFDRFYRADPARARASGNTGLGLAIVKAIVMQHGGSVGVRSELGCGTTFSLRLPLLTEA
jgi:two-component system OmpR family sensor kinase